MVEVANILDEGRPASYETPRQTFKRLQDKIHERDDDPYLAEKPDKE